MLFSWGIALILGTHFGYRNAIDSPSWPTTEGLIIKSRIVGVGGGRGGSGVRAKVHYVYDVNGLQFKGRRITYQRERGDRSEEHAQKVAERYSVGRTVRVHFRPDRPNVSVLEPGGSRYPIVGGLVLGFIIIGTAVLVWVRSLTRNGSSLCSS